jgi:hypothetical protein
MKHELFDIDAYSATFATEASIEALAASLDGDRHPLHPLGDKFPRARRNYDPNVAAMVGLAQFSQRRGAGLLVSRNRSAFPPFHSTRERLSSSTPVPSPDPPLRRTLACDSCSQVRLVPEPGWHTGTRSYGRWTAEANEAVGGLRSRRTHSTIGWRRAWPPLRRKGLTALPPTRRVAWCMVVPYTGDVVQDPVCSEEARALDHHL